MEMLNSSCCSCPSSSTLAPLAFYWDIENCTVPVRKSAIDVVQQIRCRFGNGGAEVDFVCVCDVTKERSELVNDLNLAQVTVVHVGATSKNAADEKLKCLLRRFGATHTSPGTVVLLSSDVNFAAELSDLRFRCGFHVILLHGNAVSDALIACVTAHYNFDEIVQKTPDKVPKNHSCPNLGATGHLKILELPQHIQATKIRWRLQQISDNCGGRVISVDRNEGSAVLQFRGSSAVMRAEKRLQNENVFGNRIRVEPFPPESEEADINCGSSDGESPSGSIMRSFVRINIGLKQLGGDVHHLLQVNGGIIQLDSFVNQYERHCGPLPVATGSDWGVPVEHLLYCIPGVQLCVSPLSGIKILQWAQRNPPIHVTKANVPVELIPLSKEIVELLKGQPGCFIPVTELLSAYEQHFGRPISIETYGFSRLTQFFDALSHVIEILGAGEEKVVMLAHKMQVRRFTNDLQSFFKMHMEQSPRNVEVNVGELVAFWDKYLNVQLRPIDYGVCTVEDLLVNVPESIVKVTGAGETALITFVRTASNPTVPQRRHMDQFSAEAMKILRSFPDAKIPLSKFGSAYFHYFGRQLRVADFGCGKLLDLIEGFPDILQVIDSPDKDERIVTLAESELLRVLGEQVTAMLSSQSSHEMPVQDFMQSFARFHGYMIKLSDYDCIEVSELFAKLENVVKVEESYSGAMVKLVLNRELHVVTEQILFLFLRRPDHQFSLREFQDQFVKLFGLPVDLKMLREELCDVVKIRPPRSAITTYTPGHNPFPPSVMLHPVQRFALKTRILLEQIKPLIAIGELEEVWMRFYRTPLKPSVDFGFPSVMGLIRAASHILYTKGRGFNVSVCANKNFLSSIGHGHLSETLSPLPRNLTPPRNGLGGYQSPREKGKVEFRRTTPPPPRQQRSPPHYNSGVMSPQGREPLYRPKEQSERQEVFNPRYNQPKPIMTSPFSRPVVVSRPFQSSACSGGSKSDPPSVESEKNDCCPLADLSFDGVSTSSTAQRNPRRLAANFALIV